MTKPSEKQNKDKMSYDKKCGLWP